MTKNELLKADMLDILFEHRNKNYGAYALRRNYNERLGKALGFSLGLVLCCVLFIIAKNDRNVIPDGPLVNPVAISQVELQPEHIEEPQQQQQKQDQVRQVNSVNNIVIADEADMNEQEDISVSAIGNENVDGETPVDPNTVINNVQPDPQPQPQPQPQPEPQPEVKPSYPPSFPGGDAAWRIYLRDFLHMPEELEPGQRVEVRIKFWVETDGSVSRFEIVKSGGRAFDKEVIRVMTKMPKWKSAMQNGNPIAVSFTQPVIFMGFEE